MRPNLGLDPKLNGELERAIRRPDIGFLKANWKAVEDNATPDERGYLFECALNSIVTKADPDAAIAKFMVENTKDPVKRARMLRYESQSPYPNIWMMLGKRLGDFKLIGIFLNAIEDAEIRKESLKKCFRVAAIHNSKEECLSLLNLFPEDQRDAVFYENNGGMFTAAVLSGHMGFVQFLLEKTPPARHQAMIHSDGNRAFYLAIELNNLKAAEFLFQKDPAPYRLQDENAEGSDPQAQSNNEKLKAALAIAAKKGFAAILEFVFKGQKDWVERGFLVLQDDNYPLFHIAAENGRFEVLNLLFREKDNSKEVRKTIAESLPPMPFLENLTQAGLTTFEVLEMMFVVDDLIQGKMDFKFPDSLERFTDVSKDKKLSPILDEIIKAMRVDKEGLKALKKVKEEPLEAKVEAKDDESQSISHSEIREKERQAREDRYNKYQTGIVTLVLDAVMEIEYQREDAEARERESEVKRPQPGGLVQGVTSGVPVVGKTVVGKGPR